MVFSWLNILWAKKLGTELLPIYVSKKESLKSFFMEKLFNRFKLAKCQEVHYSDTTTCKKSEF